MSLQDQERHLRIRQGGAVKRYHTRPVIGDQTVAAHSWGVAAILLEICDPSPQLLRAAIYHDVAEYDTGDVPATAKWAHPPLKAALDDYEALIESRLKIGNQSGRHLESLEWDLLKIADMLELVWFGYEQRMMGNRYAELWYEAGSLWLNRRIFEKKDQLPDVLHHLPSSHPYYKAANMLCDTRRAWLAIYQEPT